MADSKLIKVGGLWKNKSKDGSEYFKGSLSKTCDMLIFPNKHKQSHNHPDYILYYVPHEARQQVQQGQETQPGAEYHDDIDNIPF